MYYNDDKTALYTGNPATMSEQELILNSSFIVDKNSGLLNALSFDGSPTEIGEYEVDKTLTNMVYGENKINGKYKYVVPRTGNTAYLEITDDYFICEIYSNDRTTKYYYGQECEMYAGQPGIYIFEKFNNIIGGYFRSSFGTESAQVYLLYNPETDEVIELLSGFKFVRDEIS